MLLRFEVSNHRSIHEPVELSMIAVDRDRPSARQFHLLNEHVLTVAGIYGPNASGKSNVVDAMAWLSAAVGRSLRAWEDFVPRDPFRFGSGQSEPSTYEVELIVKGVRHVYRLEIDDKAVRFEGLYSYPMRKQRMLFEREGKDLHFRRGLGSAAGTRELLTPTTLALSAAARLNEPELRYVGRAIAGLRTLGPRRRARWRITHGGGFPLTHHTARLFDSKYQSHQASLFDDVQFEPPDERESALALLRFADLGIDDVVMVDEPDGDSSIPRDPRPVLQFIHRTVDQEVAFPFEEESDGTQTWFRLIGPVLSALRTGQILLFDEIDASLHPRLSARLLELFQDPTTNPLNSQLVFTSHDTSLLNHLNRDEVWLTEKGKDGATRLTALAEYGGEKVRRSLNLEKAYLQGRFGAVPEVDQFIIHRALGLAGRR